MRALPLALLLPAAACQTGAEQSFPSLLPRAIETRGDAERTPAPTVTTTDPATLDRIEANFATADRARATFTAAEPGLRRQAARAGAAGSDGWIEAQLALTALDAARAELTGAVVALDRLFQDEFAAGREPPAASLARQEALAAESARQSDAIEAIKRSLAAP